jgi:hypothetical protein
MKLGIAISAALALVALAEVSAAQPLSQSPVVVNRQIGMYPPQGPLTPWPRFVSYRSWGLYPGACEAVIFPRTAFCTGRPASFGPYAPYAPYPWSSWVYY